MTHSRCYTEYGLRRTGCVGCPFSKHINEELEIIRVYEPNLYKAAVHIFGKSYEYTAKYRAFVKEMKALEKEEKNVVYLVAAAVILLTFSVPYELGKTIKSLEKERIYDD